MDDRILLSTFTVKINNKNKDSQMLNYFNEEDDLLSIIKDFTDYIFVNTNTLTDKSGKKKIHLTLDKESILDKEERIIYGHFSSGISGDKFKLVDSTDMTPPVNVGRHHVSFRDLFFYFFIPKNKKVGYLILQRKTNFGIKLKLIEALNSYFIKQGIQQHFIVINNLIHQKVFQKMMQFGNLKRVDLVKRKIPKSLDEYMSNGENLTEINGSLRTSFSSRKSLPGEWKESLMRLFDKNKNLNENSTLEIADNISYDDIEFELELNGKRKTFYVINEQRVQPDIDVTSSLQYDLDQNPTTDSLIKQAKEMIDDFIDIKPKK